MTAFLIILIAALLAVSIWQISKIVKLGKAPDPDTDQSEVANDLDNKRNGQGMLIFVIAMYIMMIACFIGYQDFFLPDAGSAHGAEYDNLLLLTTVVIMIVQFLTQASVGSIPNWFAPSMNLTLASPRVLSPPLYRNLQSN